MKSLAWASQGVTGLAEDDLLSSISENSYYVYTIA